MIATEKITITVEATINAPVERVWTLWTSPEHIKQWCNASNDWHAPRAENDLREGGKFLTRMEARDGSMGFDFNGVYTKVEQYKEIEYQLADERKVNVKFTRDGNTTHVIESFEAENTNPEEMQRTGWQAILDNFKNYAETFCKMEKLHFQIAIDAPAGKVYKTMLDEQTYRQWTEAFDPNSSYRGSWEKGSKILFVGVNKEGKEEGMVSRIKENIPNQFVSIEHIGMLSDGKEITSGPQIEGWAGALENYSFKEEGGKTILSVDMDANEQFKGYFEQAWPKALQKLKEISE